MESAHYRHPESPGRTITLVEGDITRERVDAIVNAANAGLKGGGGVDGAIHRAGGPEVMAACRAIMAGRAPLARGEAVATTGGRLHARHVIHTAGPVYRDGTRGEPEHLAACYDNSLRLAAELEAASVALPAISCGVYGYPFEDAIALALGRMRAFLLSPRAPGAFAIRFVFFGRTDYERARVVAERIPGG